METLPPKELATLIDLLTHLKTSHDLTLSSPTMTPEEAQKLSDENALIGRILPRLTAALLRSKRKVQT